MTPYFPAPGLSHCNIVYQSREMAPYGKKRADQKEISQHQYTLSTVENLFVAIALHMLEIETGLAKLSC